jgi:hypothetical protein
MRGLFIPGPPFGTANRSYTDPYKPLPLLLPLVAGVKEFSKAKLRYVTIENGEILGEVVPL